jgi:hypothetical protein
VKSRSGEAAGWSGLSLQQYDKKKRKEKATYFVIVDLSRAVRRCRLAFETIPSVIVHSGPQVFFFGIKPIGLVRA